MSKPTPIGNLLTSLIASKGWSERVDLHSVFLIWDELVGPEIARQAQPHVIRKRILWVRVADSVWMQQLHLLKEMLLEKINARLKKGRFTDLRFQLDSSLGGSAPVREEKSPPKPPPLPDRKSRQAFEAHLQSIGDEEVKKAIRTCWLRLSNLRK